MTRNVRIGMFLAAAGVLGFLLVWAVVDLPSFGHYRGPYGGLLNHVVPPERHVTEVVTGVVFDVRGIDTLGEEFILFAAVVGVVLLLRESDAEEQEANDDVGSDALRTVGVLAVGAAVLVGVWVTAFGYVTPGGGFQGGVAIASGAILLWLVSSLEAWRPVGDEQILDPLEGGGAGAFVVIGLAALAGGLPFLTNLFGPGRYGTLQSGGSIPLVNWAAGIEVTAALLILFTYFLEQYIAPLSGGGGSQ
jgi:multicomponent Na+:H+ antiporter subunit B